MAWVNKEFAGYVDGLPIYLDWLLASAPLSPAELKAMNEPGVYCFSENGITLYVGRTKNMCKRYLNHCSVSTSHNSAPFAFRLARIETGRLKASYKVEGSRKQLMQDELFRAAFDLAKQRIRRMEVRFIKIEDPIAQVLFELYVSVSQSSLHNDFTTS